MLIKNVKTNYSLAKKSQCHNFWSALKKYTKIFHYAKVARDILQLHEERYTTLS